VGLLRLLVWLLPSAFRREYGSELVDTAKERWEAERALNPSQSWLRFWARQWWAAIRVRIDLRSGQGVLGQTKKRKKLKGDGMNGIWRDVVQSARALGARPAFTVVAVLPS